MVYSVRVLNDIFFFTSASENFRCETVGSLSMHVMDDMTLHIASHYFSDADVLYFVVFGRFFFAFALLNIDVKIHL